MCPRVRGVYRARSRTSVSADGTGALATIYGGLPPGGGIVNLGRLAKITYPGYTSGHADTIEFTSYDDAGNVLTRVDGNNHTTTYAYADKDGLLSDVSYSGASSQDVSIAYDDFDRPISVTDGTGSSSTAYDDLDLVSSSTRTYTGLSAKTFDYLYYPDGSRKEMDTSVGPFKYEYDAVGRFTKAVVAYVGREALTYLDNGWVSKRTLVGSSFLTTDYTYNAAGMLDSLTNKYGGSAVSTYNNFAYDGVFNLTSVDSTIPSTSFGGTDSFTYDSKDRLTAQSSTRNYGFSESVAYDSSGNPTTFIGSSRTYNSNNQRTGSGTFAYDGNGNPTTYTGGIFGTATCAYDRENRLTAIGSSWTAGYRADGLRAWKQVGSTKVYYLYDNGNPVMELDSSGNVIAVNGYGADGLYARWWAWNNSATTYYMFDQQGNVAERYDGNGNLISSNMNDAYGNEAYSTYGNDPFGYNAKWGYTFDRETGMFLCQHRYYDPANGRWITRDPIGYSSSANQYSYCDSSPISSVDINGARATGLKDLGRMGKVFEAGVGRYGGEWMRNVVRAMERAIADSPGLSESQDPPALRAVWWAIDHMGDGEYSVTGTCDRGLKAFGRPKCNFYVADAYGHGAGLGFGGAGVPRRKPAEWPYGADSWAGPGTDMGPFGVVSGGNAGFGDIIAFPTLGGAAAHMGMKIGPGMLIYAGGDGGKIGCYDINAKGRPATVRRYAP